MTENQTLREALQAIANIDDATNHSVDASAALDRIGQIARQALALPPDVPETTFRGMREALQLIAWSNDSKWQADCARQAIAMPTADHLPDAGKMVVDHFPDATKMIETAAPGCELERFEAWWRSVQLMTFPKEYDTKRLQDWGSIYKPKALEAWQARAALAGDAADAQRLDFLDALCSRPASSDMHMRNGSVALYVRTGIGAQLAAQGQGKVRDAIDAAMRKDKT